MRESVSHHQAAGFWAGSPVGTAWGRFSCWKPKNLTSTLVDVKFFRLELGGKIPCRQDEMARVLPSTLGLAAIDVAVNPTGRSQQADPLLPLCEVLTRGVCLLARVEPARFQFLGPLLRGVGRHVTDFLCCTVFAYGDSSSALGAEEPSHFDAGPA
ncbi:hypothetical protein Taro_051743 [Colocasia esculenta]|uniref:Uncharacterized protein n=1 Tax=Colocasia esculenta TaxID=4460 RepID=A0A843XGV8_COLES|nr:hypothetical protein [Colocasia esculenta]